MNVKNITAPINLPSTPTWRHPEITPTSYHATRDSCRSCHKLTDESFWLVCPRKNPVTGKKDCDYRVHQNCLVLLRGRKPEESAVFLSIVKLL